MPEQNKRPVVRNQHYVPRHYLRQFGYPRTELISLARIDPYHFVPRAGIGDQCKEDYFYGEDGEVDELMQIAEQDLAPVLPSVCKGNSFDNQQLNGLSMLMALLHLRTKKAVEKATLYPRLEFFKVIEEGIKSGELPAPEGGWTFKMAQISGVPRFLVPYTIPCWLETWSLTPKLLLAPAKAAFVTSDHPVILLNQFASDTDPVKTFCGFGQSGFQILLPLSPQHCLFFFDPNTYESGTGTGQTMKLQQTDVEAINALQIQSAARCVYFNDTVPENVAKEMIEKYKGLRMPAEDAMRIYPGANPNEEIYHFREPALKVVHPLSFCRMLSNPKRRPGQRREPLWTSLIGQLLDDWKEGRLKNGDLMEHMKSILPPLR